MWKYVGEGRYAVGVPARDLTNAEHEKHAARLPEGSPAAALYEKQEEQAVEQPERPRRRRSGDS